MNKLNNVNVKVLSESELSEIYGGYIGGTFYDGPKGCGNDYAFVMGGHQAVVLYEDGFINQPCGFANVRNFDHENVNSSTLNTGTTVKDPISVRSGVSLTKDTLTIVNMSDYSIVPLSNMVYDKNTVTTKITVLELNSKTDKLNEM